MELYKQRTIAIKVQIQIPGVTSNDFLYCDYRTARTITANRKTQKQTIIDAWANMFK